MFHELLRVLLETLDDLVLFGDFLGLVEKVLFEHEHGLVQLKEVVVEGLQLVFHEAQRLRAITGKSRLLLYLLSHIQLWLHMTTIADSIAASIAAVDRAQLTIGLFLFLFTVDGVGVRVRLGVGAVIVIIVFKLLIENTLFEQVVVLLVVLVFLD